MHGNSYQRSSTSVSSLFTLALHAWQHTGSMDVLAAVGKWYLQRCVMSGIGYGLMGVSWALTFSAQVAVYAVCWLFLSERQLILRLGYIFRKRRHMRRERSMHIFDLAYNDGVDVAPLLQVTSPAS